MLPRDEAACPADDCPLHQRCKRWRPPPTGDGLPRVWFLNRPEWREDGCAWFMEREGRRNVDELLRERAARDAARKEVGGG